MKDKLVALITGHNFIHVDLGVSTLVAQVAVLSKECPDKSNLAYL